MTYKFEQTKEYAKQMDKQDTLYEYRERFFLHDGEIYMDGNSLGLGSIDAENALNEAFEDYKKDSIKIWNIKKGLYFNYSKAIAAKMTSLINADEHEVVVMGSITSNIHQALATLYKPTKDRYKIIVDELNFPTDIYAVKSMIELQGLTVEDSLIVIKSKDGKTIDEEDVINSMQSDVSLILLPSVLYRSAQLLDMKKITEKAHEQGILVGWDLAHSIGAVPHDFNDIQPDFAVWCTYKYLNGGPGAVGGMYLNKRHFSKAAGLKGWFGNKSNTQFKLSHVFDQDINANGLLLGTPHIFSMAPLYGALDIFNEVGIDNIRKKSLQLTDYMMYLIEQRLLDYGFSIGNPREDYRRGGHVCLEHEEAYRISQAMRDYGVIPDYREPDVIRLAPVALYISYEDVFKVIETIERIFKEQLFLKYSIERLEVI